MMSELFSTKQVAQLANIHRDTLLRWLRENRVPEPGRNRNGWRVFTNEEAEAIARYARSGQISHQVNETEIQYKIPLPYIDSPARLSEMDWDFADAQTDYLTHNLHPYPCKFIPQIPNTLIQDLSSVGNVILDPFCGSGTTLVEALRLGRSAIGLDANPLACLISRAKTTCISSVEVETLRTLADEMGGFSTQVVEGMQPLFPSLAPILPEELPTNKGIVDWFDAHIIEECAVIKKHCLQLTDEKLRSIALNAFSSVIVSVSRQDSETRYVRREKAIKRGETYRRFARMLHQSVDRLCEFSAEISPAQSVKVIQGNILIPPDISIVDLVVCSPPYPNAFSYHLYHRTRMEWLDMDQPTFKQEEIGSHRKYSRKGADAATEDTFRQELQTILAWLARCLRLNRHACFIIGDSTIRGQVVHNDQLLIEVAEKAGFCLEANIERQLQATKKSFNPAIGKIKSERIVILRNVGGRNE
jgi:site-specific DNA-methyltransferase (cytosine-N4-specific)